MPKRQAFWRNITNALHDGEHLLVRRDDVLCTRCLSTIPVNAGDGTPLPSFVVGLAGAVKRHPATGNCTPHDRED